MNKDKTNLDREQKVVQDVTSSLDFDFVETELCHLKLMYKVFLDKFVNKMQK